MNISKAVNDIWHNAEVAGEGELTLEPLLQAANRIADALERLADKVEEGEPAEATDPAQEQLAVQSAIAWERRQIVMLVEEQFGPAPANRLSHMLGLDQVPRGAARQEQRRAGDWRWAAAQVPAQALPPNLRQQWTNLADVARQWMTEPLTPPPPLPVQPASIEVTETMPVAEAMRRWAGVGLANTFGDPVPNEVAGVEEAIQPNPDEREPE